MPKAHIAGKTADDVMRKVVDRVQASGNQITPRKGKARELIGILLEVTNPRARLSQTETRGKLFSCLGELCWYLAKSNDESFISYYLPQYRRLSENGKIYGGYGPRLFNLRGIDQLVSVTRVLKERPDSRQAVIQLFDAEDIIENHNDVPCTSALQFMIRQNRMHMFTAMRSNDVFWGLTHDLFCFTMLQEIMARTLGVDLGTYKHAVGSLHIYDKDLDSTQQFLDEGWQPTAGVAMPAMPADDPWPAINVLLKAESEIRTAGKIDDGILDTVSPYWADLIRLLMVFGCKKKRRVGEIRRLRSSLSSKVYYPFIDKVMEDLAQSHRT